MSIRETSLSQSRSQHAASEETVSLLLDLSGSQYGASYEDIHRSNPYYASTSNDEQRNGAASSSPQSRSESVLVPSKSRKWKTKVVRNFKRRIPKSKAVFLILIINILQSYCFYTIVPSTVQIIANTLKAPHNKYLLVLDDSTKAKFIDDLVLGVQTGLPALFYPIGGILGDVYVGRRLISITCMAISFLSYVILSLSLALANYYSTSIVTGVALPMTCLLLVSICNGVFNINWLTFGADQLINSPTDEVSGYIYSWYWTKNIGLFLSTSTTVVLSLPINYTNQVIPCVIPLVSAIIISVAMFIDLYARSLYDRERNNSNPITQVLCVLHNAATSRPKSRPFMSAFRYGEDPPSGLDYARQHYDGKYTDEQVGDVKSCCRIFILVTLISGFTAVYFAIQNRAVQELGGLNIKPPINSSLIDSGLTLLLMPFWSNILFPLLGHYVPNTRRRVSLGIFIGTLGILIAGVFHTVRYFMDTTDKLHSGLFFVPFVAVIVAESLVFVSALEFIYAQGPDNMKGLLIGIHYFIIGTWATVSFIVLNQVFDKVNEENKIKEANLYYYYSYAGVGLLGGVLFTIVNYFYENRRRNNPVSDIMRISRYYD